MARDLTSAMTDAVTGAVVRPIIFFEGEFNSGTVRVFSGIGSITWDGQTWDGGGDLVGISPIPESDRIEAKGVSVSLNAFDSANISLALQELRQGRAGKIWLGFLDDSDAIIADPVLVFAGRLDTADISDDGDAASITVTYENRLIDLKRPRTLRYTDAEQRARNPADGSMRFVEQLVDDEIIWGRA
jgi:hypothetical protein